MVVNWYSRIRTIDSSGSGIPKQPMKMLTYLQTTVSNHLSEIVSKGRYLMNKNKFSSVLNLRTPKKVTDADSANTASRRNLTGNTAKVISVIAVISSLFHIYANLIGLVSEMHKTNIHIAFTLFFIFIFYPFSKKSKNKGNPKFYDYIMAALGVFCPMYVFFRFSSDFAKFGVSNPFDIFMAAVTVLLILEAGRRVLGMAIPIISSVFILYALTSTHFPGPFRFPSITVSRLLYRFYLTTEGIWSTLVITSATYIFIFILFGAFLEISGGSKAFNDIGYAIGGRMSGGPAQVAVISSALMGSISGSAVANVMTTGSFTIPLMKKVGYSKDFAGGVEAAASTGGVIMPPVMGAVAFIMASTLGVSYKTIVISAIMPAVLYYVGISFSVFLEAKKRNLQGLPKESLPKLKDVLLSQGIYFLPVAAIVYTLLIGKSALYAGFVGIISSTIISWFKKDTRMGLKEIIRALESGAIAAIPVAIACAACSFIVCVATLTGIGSSLATNILKLSGGISFVALLFVALIVLLMSMGMPGNAVYIVVSVVAAPALVKMGFNVIAAHFFVLWIGTMSNMTPPVCMASYAAASISGGTLTKTALSGLKLAAAGLIIPFVFVYNPIMLMQNATIIKYLTVFITAGLGVASLAMSIHGYFKARIPFFLRITLFIAALLMIDPKFMTDIIGISILLVSIGFSMLLDKRREAKDLKNMD